MVHLLANPGFSLGDGGVGVVGQATVDGSAPGRAGVGEFAAQYIDQRFGGILAYHHREARGVHR
ncbi:hypothetical protein D9M73_256760 [compost metagenome]